MLLDNPERFSETECVMWTNLPQLPTSDSARDAQWHGSCGYRAGDSTAVERSTHRVVRLALRPGHYEATAKCILRNSPTCEHKEVWAGGPGQNTHFVIKPAGGSTALKCGMVELLTGKPASQAMYKRAQSSSASSLPDLLDTSHAAGQGSPGASPTDALSPAFQAYLLQWFTILPNALRSPGWFNGDSISQLTALHVYAAAVLAAELSLNGTPLLVTAAAAWGALRAFACNAGQAEHDIERLLQQRLPAVLVMAVCAGLRGVSWRCIWTPPHDLDCTRVPHVGTVHTSCMELCPNPSSGTASRWLHELLQCDVVQHLPNAGAALMALGLQEHYHRVVSGAVAAAHTPLSSISAGSLACGVCGQCTTRTAGADACVYLELLLHMLRSPCVHDAFIHSSLLVRCLVDGMQRGGAARQRELSRVCLTGIFTTAIHTGRGMREGAATVVPSGARILSRPAVPHHIISMVCSAMLMRVRITAMSMQAAAQQESRFPALLLEDAPAGTPTYAAQGTHTSSQGTLSLLVLQAQGSHGAALPSGRASSLHHLATDSWDADEEADAFDDMPQAFQLATRRLAATSHALQSAGGAPVVVLRGKPQMLLASAGASQTRPALLQQVLVHTSQQDFFTPSFGPLPSPDLGEDTFTLDAATSSPPGAVEGQLEDTAPPPHQAVAPTVEQVDADASTLPPLAVHVKGLRVEETEAMSPPPRRQPAAQAASPSTLAPPTKQSAQELPVQSAAHRRWAAWSMRWDPSVAQVHQGSLRAPHADAGVGVLKELVTFMSGAIALSHDVAQRVTSASAAPAVVPRHRTPRRHTRSGSMGPTSMQLSAGRDAQDVDTSFIKDVRHLVRCLVHCTCRLSSSVCGEYEQLQAATTAVMAQGGPHATYAAWCLLRKWPRADSERCISTLRMLVSSVSGWWSAAAPPSISLEPLGGSSTAQQAAATAGYTSKQLPDSAQLRGLFIRRLQWCLSSPHASLCTAAVKCVLPASRTQGSLASLVGTDIDMAEAVFTAATDCTRDGHWNEVVQRNVRSLLRSLAPVMSRLHGAQERKQALQKASSQPSGMHSAKFDKQPSAKQVSVELDPPSTPSSPQHAPQSPSNPRAQPTAAQDEQPTELPQTATSVAENASAKPSPPRELTPPSGVAYNAHLMGSPSGRIAVGMASPGRKSKSPGASSPTSPEADPPSKPPQIFVASRMHVWRPPRGVDTRTAPVRIASPTGDDAPAAHSPSSPRPVRGTNKVFAVPVPRVRLAQGLTVDTASHTEEAPPAALQREGLYIKNMSVDERSITLSAIPTAEESTSRLLPSHSRRAWSEPLGQPHGQPVELATRIEVPIERVR